MRYEWDDEKNEANGQKHGITFDRVMAVFADPDRLTVRDDRQDYGETREITLGMIESRLFYVVTTEREGGAVTRIISARKANSRERRHYANYQTNT